MKGCTFCFLVLSLVLLLLLHSVAGRHITKTTRPHHGHHRSTRQTARDGVVRGGNDKVEEAMSYYRRERRAGAETVEIAGSSLPDCSHACGSCYPCRLVMVSFVCASLEEAETCPMAYKCMCHNKSYPVP